MPTPVVDTINTAIRQTYLPQVVDNIFLSNALLMLLLKGAKKQRGGLKVRVPVEYEDAGNSQGSYSGYEVLNTEQPEILDTAIYDWAQAYAAINISGRDEMMNMGSDGIIDLIEARMKNAEKRLKKVFTDFLFAAAGANASDEISSILDIIGTGRTLGGINSSTYTWWDAKTLANGAANYTELITDTDEDYLIKDMANVWNQCSDGPDTPNLIITDDPTMEAYEHIIGKNARYEGTSILADAGWQVFHFKGAQMVADKSCTATNMYFLNLRYLYFKVHPDRNFSFKPFREPVNQDAKTAFIFWMGQFVTSQPRRQGSLTSIVAA